MRERVVEQYLKKRIIELGGICLKWQSPQNNGVPDRIVFVFRQVWFIELKSPIGTTSKLQSYFKRIILKYTDNYRVVYTLKQVDELINEIQSQR